MAQDTSTLKAQKREQSGKGPARRLRAKGLVPAVCYGPFGEPLHVAVDPQMSVQDAHDVAEEVRHAVFHDNPAQRIPDTGTSLSQWDIFTRFTPFLMEMIRQNVI